MSYSKYEFLSVRTHPSDVNEHCSAFNDEFLIIYGLWKKSSNLSFWKNFFQTSKFHFWKKIFYHLSNVLGYFQSVYNDQNCPQNFSAILTQRSHEHAQLFLKKSKSHFLTYGFHQTGVLRDEFLWSEKLFHQKVWVLKNILNIYNVLISPKPMVLESLL